MSTEMQQIIKNLVHFRSEPQTCQNSLKSKQRPTSLPFAKVKKHKRQIIKSAVRGEIVFSIFLILFLQFFTEKH
jgi:hypothetical protein